MAQANASIAIWAYISGAWTELDVVNPYRMSWGMSDNNPTTRLADIGELKFAVNNSTGQYTPGGPSGLAGWKKGIPVKLVCTYESEEYVRFRGVIDDIDPRPNVKDKKAYITVLDYLDYAARHPIVNPGVATNQTGDEVIQTVIDEIEIDPQQTDLDAGVETFPTSFDTITSNTKAYNEFAKVALSELGYVYLRKDRTYGETLVFEAADARHGWQEAGDIPVAALESEFLLLENGDNLLLESGDDFLLNQVRAAVFGGTAAADIPITNFEAPYGDHVINRLTVYANPRRLSASPEVLFSLDEEIVIGSGSTYVLKGTYADPDGGLPINAQDMITPVATTDYTVFTATGGGGSDITADLTVSITYGTEGFTASLTNGNAVPGFLNFFRTRGTGIYIYNPIEHTATNSDSVVEFEAQTESLNQRYKNDLYSAAAWADSQVDEHNQPRVVLNSIEFIANRSPACMMAFLHTDIGDLRYIEIDELGITGNYYIQGIEVTMNSGIITVRWIIVAALSLLPDCGLSPMAVEFTGAGTTDAVNFGFLPNVYSDVTPETISMSAWFYIDTFPSAVATAQIFTLSSDGGGLRFYLSSAVTDEVRFYNNVFNGGPGIWIADTTTINTSTWYNMVATIDISSASNDPTIYINGTLQTLTESSTPSGDKFPKTGTPVVLGNLKTATLDYTRPFDGKVFDARIYHRILTAQEATDIYNSGTKSMSVGPQDMVFQAVTVRTENLADYTDATLTSGMTFRDAAYGAVGIPHGTPIGRAAP